MSPCCHWHSNYLIQRICFCQFSNSSVSGLLSGDRTAVPLGSLQWLMMNKEWRGTEDQWGGGGVVLVQPWKVMHLFLSYHCSASWKNRKQDRRQELTAANITYVTGKAELNVSDRKQTPAWSQQLVCPFFPFFFFFSLSSWDSIRSRTVPTAGWPLLNSQY